MLAVSYTHLDVYKRQLLIRPVQAGGGQRAALGIYIRAICVGDLKLDTFQRLLCDGILLDDDEVALGLIAELYRGDFVGLDLDRLRRIVQQVTLFGAGLLDDKRGAGGNVGNRERCLLYTSPQYGVEPVNRKQHEAQRLPPVVTPRKRRPLMREYILPLHLVQTGGQIDAWFYNARCV